MPNKKAKTASSDQVDPALIRAFNETPPPQGRLIFDQVQQGIIMWIQAGKSVREIAERLTSDLKLSKAVDPKALQVWLGRRGLSCRSVRNRKSTVPPPISVLPITAKPSVPAIGQTTESKASQAENGKKQQFLARAKAAIDAKRHQSKTD